MKINHVQVKDGKTLTYEEIKKFGNNLKIIDDLMNQNFIFASKKFGNNSELCEILKRQEVMISSYVNVFPSFTCTWLIFIKYTSSYSFFAFLFSFLYRFRSNFETKVLCRNATNSHRLFFVSLLSKGEWFHVINFLVFLLLELKGNTLTPLKSLDQS